jgi:hypothetical protein
VVGPEAIADSLRPSVAGPWRQSLESRDKSGDATARAIIESGEITSHGPFVTVADHDRP